MINLFFVDEFGKKFPAWDSVALGDVCEVIGGGTPDTANEKFWNGGVNWFSPSEISKAGKYVSSSVRKISEDGLKSSSAKMLPKNSILLTTRASIGYMAINTEECCTNQGFQSLVVDESKADFNFIYYLRGHIKKELDKKASGSTFAEISGKEVRKIGIPLPSLPEQKKIAEFFSALDERIALTADKVKLLKEQKQGYLQQVFARELVFTDENGEQYPEWEEKKLGEVATSLDNKRIPLSGQERNSLKGNIPYYGATQVVDYINDFIFDEDLVLIGEDGVDFESYLTKPIAQFVTGKSWVNNHAHVFRPDTNQIMVKFLYYSVAHKDVTKYVVGGGRAKLNKSEALKIEIPLPSLPEQEKIVEFFSALDEQIELTENKLELLKEQKKGYLQGIFG